MAMTGKTVKTVMAALAAACVAMAAIVAGCAVIRSCDMMPDDTHYASLEQRADAALKAAKRHGLSTNYCLLVDYSVPSGKPRLYVWSFKSRKTVARTYAMHGAGGGSTARKPVFSNKPGSECSSLGRFEVTLERGIRMKKSLRLKGLDTTNSNAYGRGLMVHGSLWVNVNCWRKYIPLNRRSSQGCVTVSTRGFDYIDSLAHSESKPMLLWTFC